MFLVHLTFYLLFSLPKSMLIVHRYHEQVHAYLHFSKYRYPIFLFTLPEYIVINIDIQLP